MARDQRSPGSRKSNPSVSIASATSIPRAVKRDPEAVMAAYRTAYETANRKPFIYKIWYEAGWVLFSYAGCSLSFDRKRLGELEDMTARLRARTPQGIEAQRAETQRGSVGGEEVAHD